MNRISMDRLSLIIWLVALLFLSLIPMNRNERVQDDQSDVSTIWVVFQQNNSEQFLDVEETEDASKQHVKEIHLFPDCLSREMATVRRYGKYLCKNKNQIDITFFNLPPPLQSS